MTLRRLILVVLLLLVAIVMWAQFHGPSGQALPSTTIATGGSDGSALCSSGGVNVPCLFIYGSTSAANETAATERNGELVEKGPRWTVISNPAAGTVASASRAAGGASVRHVLDCVSFSAAASTAVAAATLLTINARDGATGAGTIIWTQEVEIPASAGSLVVPFSICGLNLPGSVNTAMTLEFSAGVANLVQATSVSGYDVQ